MDVASGACVGDATDVGGVALSIPHNLHGQSFSWDVSNGSKPFAILPRATSTAPCIIHSGHLSHRRCASWTTVHTSSGLAGCNTSGLPEGVGWVEFSDGSAGPVIVPVKPADAPWLAAWSTK